MNYCAFIQTNHKQMVGALVAEYALRRFSLHADSFQTQIIDMRNYPWFAAREGQVYLRDGIKRVWLNDDLQSFTPTRFLPPELMGFQGRAVVIDPDVFFVSDVWDLFARDMQGKSILCRRRSGPKGLIDRMWASSVMVLDCAHLTHWRVEEQFNELFELKRDYQPWIGLRLEDQATLGPLEHEWNDFDRFTLQTRALHTTKRRTQPWKTGLPVDFRISERFRLFPPLAWVVRARRHLFGEYGMMGHYKQHPDPAQQNLFFGLLKECIEQGIVSEEFLREEMAANHVRHDAFHVLDTTPNLPPTPEHPLTGSLPKAA